MHVCRVKMGDDQLNDIHKATQMSSEHWDNLLLSYPASVSHSDSCASCSITVNNKVRYRQLVVEDHSRIKRHLKVQHALCWWSPNICTDFINHEYKCACYECSVRSWQRRVFI